ncbi:MAG: hypothetical protein FP816_09155 [Desulfobacteraceae bacterium]|nr:hypothetical protein [Desulfobacteraceae bacterium]MBU4001347.1 DUF3280 domain-containing protein [Pseudomonadota bacterium]
MKTFKPPIGILYGSALCMILFFMQACSTTPERAVSREQNPRIATDTMLVLPFQNMTEIYGEGEHVKSPLSNRFYLAGKIEADGEDYLNGKLRDLLEKRKDFRVISPEDQGDALIKESSGHFENSVSIQQLVEMAGKAGADCVLVGYVYKYSDRVGNTMSVSSAASVAFELFLISTKNNSVIWSACFSETQKSLSEDLTKINKVIQRGVKWITVQEMAGAALTQLIGEIPENNANY